MAETLIEQLAEDIGVHPVSAMILAAGGCPGTEWLSLGPFALSKAAVAREFGVSERTVSTWLASKGCPGKTDNGYSLPHIRQWRLAQTGGDGSEQRGEYVRGLLRVFRSVIFHSLPADSDSTTADREVDGEPVESGPDDAESARAVGLDFLLTDADIDRIVAEVWPERSSAAA
ncbi:MAG: hypothetical protein ACYTGL_18100 [Planctomycetota bacterium]|jgi:hypothetical protein